MSKANTKDSPYQLLDPLNSDEYKALKADIEKRGVMIPVEKDEDGHILDGHHRSSIASELGIDCPTLIRRFASEQEKREHVIKINLARRHFDGIRWGQAFSLLLQERGVKTGRGARNDLSSSGNNQNDSGAPKQPPANNHPEDPKPRTDSNASRQATKVSTSATVAEVASSSTGTMDDVAKELGVSPRTARQRTKQYDEYQALPKRLRDKVDSKELTLAQAKREHERQAKRDDLAAKAKAAKAEAVPEQSPWEVIEGDCIEILESLPPASARLIFADPPYNQGVDYGKGKAADRLPKADFLDWTERWMRAAERLLTPDGSMWVMISDEYAGQFRVILEDKIGLHPRNWIKWYETFGINCQGKFNRCSRHIFYMTRSDDPRKIVFNTARVSRASDRQTKYGDKRADPHGKVWDDVWHIPRLVDNAKERLPDFPTQLPVDLLMAVVGCASDPGDLVVDPFNGSGTTGVASIRLGRRYIGIDKSAKFVPLSRQRLATTQRDPNDDE